MNAASSKPHLLVIGDVQVDSPFISALRAAVCVTSISLTADQGEEGVASRLSASRDEIERIDAVIISLAPLAWHDDPLETLTLSTWEAALHKQFRLPFMICKAVLNEFLFEDGIESMVLLLPVSNPIDAIQSAMSEGLLALVRSISQEYGSRGIHCNGVRFPSLLLDQPSRLDPLLQTIGFLISPDSSYISGEILPLTEPER